MIEMYKHSTSRLCKKWPYLIISLQAQHVRRKEAPICPPFAISHWGSSPRFCVWMNQPIVRWDILWFPKILVSPNHPSYSRIFPHRLIDHPFWGIPMDMESPMQFSQVQSNTLAECSQRAVSTDFAEPPRKCAPPMKFVGFFVAPKSVFVSLFLQVLYQDKICLPQKNVFGWFIVIIHRNWDINQLN